MPDLPTGTVTFLFTDIEGSTKLAQAHPAAWEPARARHHTILRDACEAHRGYVFQIIGDAFCVAFPTAHDALAAALAAQRSLQSTFTHPESTMPDPLAAAVEPPFILHPSAPFVPRQTGFILRVRMGLHTGAADARDGEYHGYLTLAHVQRVMSTAYGGQTLLSNAAAALVSGHLPDNVSLRDMGEHRLKGLLNPERLWQMAASDLPQDFPPLQTLNAIPNNLPIQVTSFVGRERELAELQRLLTTPHLLAEGSLPSVPQRGRLGVGGPQAAGTADAPGVRPGAQAVRLLTLTGSGGTGKTRLSLQVAAEVLNNFKDGVWFVELAPLADPSLVPQTVATVLGVRDEPGRPLLATLIEWLRPKQLLLILDNCEHLIDACAKFADAVLHTGPELQLLASSREALGIAGETAYRVPSLECPNAAQAAHETVAQLTQYAAVQLFIARAAQAQAKFTVTNANAPAIAQICYRLDGIPLAIELAAARVKVFPPEQIAARLDDRFRLLTGGSRTALPRQQTLRGAIDWSYSLLSEPERILLRRLSVFAGGWFFEAAESVCSGEGIELFEVLDLITSLEAKSLLVNDDVSGAARYHLLETIRQYSRDKLFDSGESTRVRTRHLSYYSQQAVAFAENWAGSQQATWFGKVGADIDNFRAALDWSLESGDILTGMLTAGELCMLWMQRYPAEGLDRLSKFLSRVDAQELSTSRTSALYAESYLLYLSGNLRAARRSASESLEIAREVGNERLIVEALGISADQSVGLREYDVAFSLYTESLERSREAGLVPQSGDALQGLGDVALQQGDLERAQSAYEEAVTAFTPIGESLYLPVPLRRLGQIAVRRAEYKRAEAFIQESLTLNREGKDVRGVAACLAALAAVRSAQGRALDAARMCGTVDAALDALHSQMMPVDQSEYEQTLATLRNDLGPAAFEAAFAEGRTLTVDQATALALGEARSNPSE